MDINVAGYRSDLFNDSWCTVDKVISYPFSVGAAVNHNADKLERLFRVYLKENQAIVTEFAQDVSEKNATEEQVKQQTYLALLNFLDGAVGKISTFQQQGPRFDPRICRDLNICVTFFTAKHCLTAAWLVQFVRYLPSSQMSRVQESNICVIFSAKDNSLFQPSEIGKQNTSVCWELTCDRSLFLLGEVQHWINHDFW